MVMNSQRLSTRDSGQREDHSKKSNFSLKIEMANSTVQNSSKTSNESAEVAPCEKFLVRISRILRITGMLSINSVFTDNVTGKSSIWEPVILTIGLMQLTLLLWFEAAQMVTKWKVDPDRAIDPTAGTFTCCICIVKASSLWLNRKELQKLLRHMVITWKDSNRRIGLREEILKIAKNTCYWEKWYIVSVLMACLAYALRPYAFLLHHYLYERSRNISYDYSLTIHPGKYFWSTDTMGKYIACICWEQITVLFVGLSALSTDCVFAQLTTHAAIQFRVLQHDLESLASSKVDFSDGKSERILIQQLSSIVEKHCEVYRHWERIKRTFAAIIFTTLILTAANTCLCAFQLQKELSHKNWSEVFRNLLHAFILGVESLMYCGYAHQLSEQSFLVSRAAYDCQWMDRSKEFNVMLTVIMMRAQRPLDCTVYGLIAPNLAQVMLIFKAAASYFTLLKSLT